MSKYISRTSVFKSVEFEGGSFLQFQYLSKTAIDDRLKYGDTEETTLIDISGKWMIAW